MKTITLIRRGLAFIALFAGLIALQPLQAQNLLADPGFEGGSPNASWYEFSTNFGTPLCTAGNCGTGSGTGPHSGLWWAWFGGIGFYEEGEMNQDVVIPEGTATLKFWLEIPAFSGNGIDYLVVQIDGNTIFSVLENTPGYDPYAEVVLDVSTYADGQSHNLRFYSEIFGPTTTNFFVDDVELTVVPAAPPVPLKSWSLFIVIGLIAAVVIFRFRNILSA